MRLLIIGALNGQASAASQIAYKRGASVRQVGDVDSALSSLRAGQGADLIMVDVKSNIAQLVQSLVSERIVIPVVACGVENDAKAAVMAIKAGAKEYIPLPPDEELIAAVLEAIAEEENELLFHSPAMEKVMQMASQVAASEASVLITGESGTGKEVIARYIHRKSRRSDKTLISVNCAAIPENLLESELFGHEKGAFTGAVARRIGKFEEANHSSLLLDEISEMDIRLQAKLLRAIQEREIDRVGGSKPVKLDLRILATSNRDLQQEATTGRFREDLFFRLSVIHLHLPPLRERREDIPQLTAHFIKKYAQLNAVSERPLSKGAAEKLYQYHWPGNVRELENTLHRAVLLANGDEISEEAIVYSGNPNSSATIATAVNNIEASGLVGRTVESVEKELILKTLDHCLGNRTHAANILGISIRTLRNKLKAYGDSGI